MKLDMKMTESPLAALERLQEDVKQHVVRPAAHAGALVFYEEVRRNAPVYQGEAFTRKNGVKVTPSQLRNAIYRVYVKDKSDESRAFYQISWNHTKAPHGHLIEYGHWIVKRRNGVKVRVGRAPAIGFVRRSFDRAQAAVDAMRERAAERMQEVLRRTVVDDFGNEVDVGVMA